MPSPHTHDLYDLLDAWGMALRAEGRTLATVRTRRYGITGLATAVDPLTATTAALREWLAGHDSAPWTVRTYFLSLRGWYAFLLAEGVRADDPTAAMKPPKTPRRVPRPIGDDALEACLAHAEGDTYAFLVLAAFEGLRVSEIARVRGQDVTRSGIRVAGKGGREDVLPTHPRVWAVAQTMPRMGWWFPSPALEGRPVTAETVSVHLSRLFAELGIQGTAHQLRHSFGTRVLAASGRDLLTTSQLMRHQNPATTAGYLLVEDERRRAVILGLGDRSA